MQEIIDKWRHVAEMEKLEFSDGFYTNYNRFCPDHSVSFSAAVNCSDLQLCNFFFSD